MKKLAVVILNYNGKNWLEKFLPNVIACSNATLADVIVADNASTDGSCDFMQTQFSQLRLIELNSNTGYAGGYNKALQSLNYEYFVLLNSDVEVSEGWIDGVLRKMEDDGQVAAAQPLILSYNEKNKFEYAGAAGGFIDFLGYPYCRGRIFESLEENQGQYNDDSEIHWASGACLFVRKDVFDAVGGLDDSFFAHMEEIDLCWRIRNRGYKIMCYTNAVVYHVGGGTLPQGNPRKTFLNFRNNLQMLAKNLSMFELLWKIPLRLVLDGIAALYSAWKKKTWVDIGAIFKAHFAFYYRFPGVLLQRKTTKQRAALYPHSVVYQYFVQAKRKFTDLKK